MNKMKTGLVAAAVLAGFSNVAMADDTSGFYLMVAAGQTRESYPQAAVDAQIRAVPGVTSWTSAASSNPTAYKLQGGYQFNRNFAVEGGYTDLGKWSYSGSGTSGAGPISGYENDKAHAWHLSAVGILPIADSFGALGKLGVASARTTGSAAATVATATPVVAVAGGGISKTDLTYGLALKYDFNRNIFARFDWDNYNLGTTLVGRVNVWTLGVGYKF